jgi:hypothetical protein
MRGFFEEHRGREVRTTDFISAATRVLGRDVESDLRPWLDRTGLPDPRPVIKVEPEGEGFLVTVRATEASGAYRLASSVAVETLGQRHHRPFVIEGREGVLEVRVPEKPRRVVFDALSDIPVMTDRYHTFGSFAEEFHRTLIVYGTARQAEANHTLALRFQAVLADAFSEILPPVRKDSEVSEAELSSHDLFVLGDVADNTLLARLAPELPVTLGPGYFRFQDTLHSGAHDGLYLALPSPFGEKLVLHVVLANSPQQLFEMTKTYRSGLPAFAVFKGEKVISEGHFGVERFSLAAP